MGRTVVIGLGRRERRDDGIGFMLVEKLRRLCPGIEVYTVGDDLTEIIELVKDADHVIIIDASRRGERPGTISKYSSKDLVEDAALSSHGLSLRDVLGMADALGLLKASLVIYAVEGGDFGYGEGLSEEVQESLETLLEEIRRELGC